MKPFARHLLGFLAALALGAVLGLAATGLVVGIGGPFRAGLEMNK
jgi:uncharacterized membrane protein YedE/YeeE